MLQNVDVKRINVDHSNMTLIKYSFVNDWCLFFNEIATFVFGTHNFNTNWKDECKHWSTKECSINQLNDIFQQFCNYWKLKVYKEKTKIIILCEPKLFSSLDYKTKK